MLNKIKNVNFKDGNQPMTDKDRAMFMFVAMSSAERLPNQHYASAVPEDQKPYFGDTGNIYFDDRKNQISTSCMTRGKGSNTASISMEDRPLTNPDLTSLVKVRPDIDVKIDDNASPYENLANMFLFEVGMVQVREDQFRQDKENVSWFQKVVSKVKTGREPYERDTTITEKIGEKAGYLYSGSDSFFHDNVKSFASTLMDLAYDVQKGKDPMDIINDNLVEKESSDVMGD